MNDLLMNTKRIILFGRTFNWAADFCWLKCKESGYWFQCGDMALVLCREHLYSLIAGGIDNFPPVGSTHEGEWPWVQLGK